MNMLMYDNIRGKIRQVESISKDAYRLASSNPLPPKL